MDTLILIVLVTLLVSGLCSLFEAVLYSTRMATLEAARADKKRSHLADRFMAMKRNVGAPTAAILILNTIAHTAGAAVAGSYALKVFGENEWNVLIFSAVLTVAILLLSEILPKNLGATNWRALWPYMVRPLHVMQTVLMPAIWFSERFSALFGSKGGAHASITEDEIKGMIKLGAQAGELSTSELVMLDRIFHFDDLVCCQVMVPRPDVAFLRKDGAPEAAFAEIRRSRHTRYPVCESNLDDMAGILHIKDLLSLPAGAPIDWKRLCRPVTFVPESMRISRLLRDMQRSRQHLAAVVDEHGVVVGIVTLENIIEQIVGSVQDEFDDEVAEVEPISPGVYRVRGRIQLVKLQAALGLVLEAPGVQTLSGYLVSTVGRFMKLGEEVDVPGAKLKILSVRNGQAVYVEVRLFNSAS